MDFNIYSRLAKHCMIRKMKGNVTTQIIFMHKPKGLEVIGVMGRNCWHF